MSGEAAGLRVLEVIAGLDNGGAEIALLRRLARQPSGVSTTVLTEQTVPNAARTALDDAGVRLVSHRIGWRDGAWFAELVRQVRPQVIVSHSPGETVKMLLWGPRLKVPVVVVAHHSLVSDDTRLAVAKKALVRVLNRRAALHIAVSGAAARGDQCSGARRVVVQPLGATLGPDEPQDHWPAGTRLRLLALSRLVWFKNLPGLVAAVVRSAEPLRAGGAHLLIVGTGPEADQIRAAVHADGIDDLVTLDEHWRDPAGLLRAADVLVSASTSEGGPLTLFEASLAGTRILATPVGVAPEVVAEDAHSRLTRGASVAELVNGLLACLQDGPVTPAEREARIARAQRWDAGVASRDFYGHLSTLAAPPSSGPRVPPERAT